MIRLKVELHDLINSPTNSEKLTVGLISTLPSQHVECQCEIATVDIFKLALDVEHGQAPGHE